MNEQREIDWTNDEQVVRATFDDMSPGVTIPEGTNYAHIRRSSLAVIAFERAHRPVLSESPEVEQPKDEPAGTGFEEWWTAQHESDDDIGTRERIAREAWHAALASVAPAPEMPPADVPMMLSERLSILEAPTGEPEDAGCSDKRPDIDALEKALQSAASSSLPMLIKFSPAFMVELVAYIHVLEASLATLPALKTPALKAAPAEQGELQPLDGITPNATPEEIALRRRIRAEVPYAWLEHREAQLQAAEERADLLEKDRDHQAERNVHHMRLLDRYASLEGREHLQTKQELEEVEQHFSQAYFLIKGESPRWSDTFDYQEAMQDIDDAQRCLRSEISHAETALQAANERAETLERHKTEMNREYSQEYERVVKQRDEAWQELAELKAAPAECSKCGYPRLLHVAGLSLEKYVPCEYCAIKSELAELKEKIASAGLMAAPAETAAAPDQGRELTLWQTVLYRPKEDPCSVLHTTLAAAEEYVKFWTPRLPDARIEVVERRERLIAEYGHAKYTGGRDAQENV